MIARFCAETFDWKEMVGDWVCDLGEDDCWIYLCPMMSLRCLPLATNEEALAPYFEGVSLGGPRMALSVDVNSGGYANVFKYDMFGVCESRNAGVMVNGKVVECCFFACYDIIRKVCLRLPLSEMERRKPVCNECRMAYGLPVQYPLYSGDRMHQEIGTRFIGDREYDYCRPWYNSEEGVVDRGVLARLLVRADWGGVHVTGGENDGLGGGAFVRYDSTRRTSEVLIDEYMRLNVSVSGAVSYLLPIEVRRVMAGRFDVWATIVDVVSRIPEYRLWDKFYDHDTTKLVHLEDVGPVPMAPTLSEDVVSASALRMLPMIRLDVGDGIVSDKFDLLEVAEFYEDEHMKQFITDDNEDVHLRKSTFLCDMKKVLTRRVRAELASGMMIKELDTFAVTIYQIDTYKKMKLYKDVDRAKLIFHTIHAVAAKYEEVLRYFGQKG